MVFWRSGDIPPDYKSGSRRFTVDVVDDTKAAKQLTELRGTEYIMKEVMFSNWDTALLGGYANLNEAATDDDTDDLATRFGETDFNTFSAIIIDGNLNGDLNKVLTTKPYVHVFPGTGATGSRTIRGVVKYYYK